MRGIDIFWLIKLQFEKKILHRENTISIEPTEEYQYYDPTKSNCMHL